MCSSMLHNENSVKYHRQVSYLQQQPCRSHRMLPGYAVAPTWNMTGRHLTCSKGYAMGPVCDASGCLTCSKGLVHFSGDGESLVSTSPEHTLQLGHQHDRLQSCHLGGHQLTHTQLVTHHALVGFQSGFQLQHRQTVVLCGTDHAQQSSLWAQDQVFGLKNE